MKVKMKMKLMMNMIIIIAIEGLYKKLVKNHNVLY